MGRPTDRLIAPELGTALGTFVHSDTWGLALAESCQGTSDKDLGLEAEANWQGLDFRNTHSRTGCKSAGSEDSLTTL